MATGAGSEGGEAVHLSGGEVDLCFANDPNGLTGMGWILCTAKEINLHWATIPCLPGARQGTHSPTEVLCEHGIDNAGGCIFDVTAKHVAEGPNLAGEQFEGDRCIEVG